MKDKLRVRSRFRAMGQTLASNATTVTIRRGASFAFWLTVVQFVSR